MKITQGNLTIKGIIKNGIDSSTLLNIMLFSEENEFKTIFKFPPHLLYCHELSYKETLGVLINRKGYSEQEAKQAIQGLKKELKLITIRRKRGDRQLEKYVEKVNADLVESTGDEKLRIGILDIMIISGFIKEKIGVAHSADQGFLKTCEALKIETKPLSKKKHSREF